MGRDGHSRHQTCQSVETWATGGVPGEGAAGQGDGGQGLGESLPEGAFPPSSRVLPVPLPPLPPHPTRGPAGGSRL